MRDEGGKFLFITHPSSFRLHPCFPVSDRNEITMSQLFRFPSAVKRDPVKTDPKHTKEHETSGLKVANLNHPLKEHNPNASTKRS